VSDRCRLSAADEQRRMQTFANARVHVRGGGRAAASVASPRRIRPVPSRFVLGNPDSAFFGTEASTLRPSVRLLHAKCVFSVHFGKRDP